MNLSAVVVAKTSDGTLDRSLHTGDIFRHFKGAYYMVLDIAQHTETKEQLVIYKSLLTKDGEKVKEHLVWARPLEMFLSPVDREKYPDADQEYRLVKVIIPGCDLRLFKHRLPKVGEFINSIQPDPDTGYRIHCGKVTKIAFTIKGVTIYTDKKGFYPINTRDYDFAPNSQFPQALADYYFGDKMTIEQVQQQAEEFRKRG